MTTAVLGVSVRPDGVRKTTGELGQFTRSAENAERGAKSVSSSNTFLTATAEKATAALKRQVAQFAAMAASAFAFRAVTQTLAGFENSMAQVAAITGATGSELAALRDIAKDLGATTEFSASQAADGLRFLGMAGFDAAESISAIPDVLNLATAASMDLAQAADITSNIMGAFGIAATNAHEAADVLGAAAG